MLNFYLCINDHSGLAKFHAPAHSDMKRWETEKLPYKPGETIFVRVANLAPSKISKEGTSVLVEHLDGIGLFKVSTTLLENIAPGDITRSRFAEKQLINSNRRKKIKIDKTKDRYNRRERDENNFFDE